MIAVLCFSLFLHPSGCRLPPLTACGSQAGLGSRAGSGGTGLDHVGQGRAPVSGRGGKHSWEILASYGVHGSGGEFTGGVLI